MKLRNLRNEQQPRLMIIPMIDIIFFLLVFFMMSTLYMVEQHTIPVNLPQSVSGQSDVTGKVIITVTREGNILFGEEAIPPSLVKKRAQLELAKQNNVVFLLGADKEAAYGAIVAVLDGLKQAGAQRVAVSTERRP
ncbi:putative membrane protein [Propionispora sp. 2/2-37]|uniref:ExbD/TolR family protein n=1 Tax=Propionispora sp. 2/2-37 TaxID=1677858 RepID=UPI0006BB65E3|nr:biopolymer transporter ExbD [Propionispora sp. 2/2-37]CUH94652.1 putative membrane protein [Propionispora sp. 2/2-37]